MNRKNQFKSKIAALQKINVHRKRKNTNEITH